MGIQARRGGLVQSGGSRDGEKWSFQNGFRSTLQVEFGCMLDMDDKDSF